jgi:hypothetical protein
MSPGIINESGGLQLKSLSGIDPDSIPAFKLLMNLPLRSARIILGLSAPLLQHDRQFQPRQLAVGVLGSLFLRCGDKARWPVVARTALSVLLTCWPPGPLARMA